MISGIATPAPGRRERINSVFRKWFEVRFYPLIQDLVGEELTTTEVDQAFIDGMRTALEGLEQHS